MPNHVRQPATIVQHIVHLPFNQDPAASSSIANSGSRSKDRATPVVAYGRHRQVSQNRQGLPSEHSKWKPMETRQIRKKLEMVETYIVRLSTSSDVIPVNTKKEIDTLTGQMKEICGRNVRIQDEEGRDLVWRFKNGPELVGVHDQGILDRLKGDHSAAIDDVIKHCVLKNPCGSEGRHLRSVPVPGSGTLQLGVWANLGETTLGLTAGTRQKSAVQEQRIANLYRDCGGLFQVIGQLFKAIDHSNFERFQDLYTKAMAFGGADNINVSEWQIFCSMILVHKLQVDPHIDGGDCKDGWVAMFVTGQFTGGDLVLPALGIKLDYQPGDLIYMRSAELEHYVDDWHGDRTGVVMFNKKSTANKVCTDLGLPKDTFDPRKPTRLPRVMAPKGDVDDMNRVDDAL